MAKERTKRKGVFKIILLAAAIAVCIRSIILRIKKLKDSAHTEREV